MTANEQKVFCKIVRYLNDANFANALLSEQLNGNPHYLWMNRKIEQTGNPKKEIIFYAFHGVGCSIETKDYQVNFDYNSDGTIKTFNSFMVFHHSRNDKVQIPEDVFNQAYQELINKKIIVKSNDITGKEEEFSGNIKWI